MRKSSTNQRPAMNIKLPASLKAIWTGILDWWDSWLDYEVITIVWFVAQITVVLGPPATFGLYYVTNTMARDGEAIGVKGMIHGARMYFWKAILWGVINWVALFLATLNIYFYSQVNSTFGLVAEVIVIILLLMWLVTQFYAVPFFMEQVEPNVFLALKNGLFLSLATPFYTFVIMILVVVVIVLSGLFVIPLFLGAPALISALGTRALFDRLIAFGLKKPDVDPREVR
jgi:uncharacterized membrane protein YesL